MDPNAALTQIRSLVEQMDTLSSLTPEPTVIADMADLGNDLTVLVRGLDQWLSQDGFLPSDWQTNDSKVVHALRQLPWGEDVDINGGDLVDFVGRLMAATDEPDLLDRLTEYAVEKFGWTPAPMRPGNACQFGQTFGYPSGYVVHRRWGEPGNPQPGDCDEYPDGTITDARGRVVGNLHNREGERA